MRAPRSSTRLRRRRDRAWSRCRRWPRPPISSTSPLVTGTTKAIAPNVFFVLDDSSSMNFEYVPDSVAEDATKQLLQERRLQQDVLRPDGHLCAAGADRQLGRHDHQLCERDLHRRRRTTASARRAAPPTNLSTNVQGLLERRQLRRRSSHASTTTRQQQAYYYNYTSGTAPTTCAANNKLHQGAGGHQLGRGAPTSPTGTATTASASTDDQVRHRRRVQDRSTTSSASASPY